MTTKQIQRELDKVLAAFDLAHYYQRGTQADRIALANKAQALQSELDARAAR